MKKHGHKIILGVCGTFIGLLVIFAINKTHPKDIINLTLVGIGSIAMLYTGLVTAYMSYMSNCHTDLQRIYDKNKNTQQLLFKFDDGVIYKARKFTRKISTDSCGKDDILKQISANEGLTNSVIMLFNYFDHIRIAIQMDVVNKKIIIDALGITINDICDKFEKWVDTKPNIRKDVDKLLKLLKEDPTS